MNSKGGASAFTEVANLVRALKPTHTDQGCPEGNGADSRWGSTDEMGLEPSPEEW